MPMAVVKIHEAKTHFSQLVNRALKGEEIIIARGDVKLLRLTPFFEEQTERKGGQLFGMIQISEDFDDPLPEDMLQLFYGRLPK
jgi:antitoxin (DNA-binding transcriptional repressor) of toxin-antitoxin stability system